MVGDQQRSGPLNKKESLYNLDMKEYTVKVWDSGTKEWCLNGKRDREDGPAYEGSDGTKMWFLNGKTHREDGPAVEYSNGTKEWYLNGNLHREDGPAVEGISGTKVWCLNGKTHREDGPAVERSDGTKEWWINDVELTEEEFNKRTKVTEVTLEQIAEKFAVDVDKLRIKDQ